MGSLKRAGIYIVLTRVQRFMARMADAFQKKLTYCL